MIPNNVWNIVSKFVPNMGQFQNAKTPDELAQMLLNSGRVNQAQVNQARQMWNQQPNIRQMIQQKYGC